MLLIRHERVIHVVSPARGRSAKRGAAVTGMLWERSSTRRRSRVRAARTQGTASNRYADWMASKKRHSAKGNGPRQGISGNPQRRAEQLAHRLAIADEPDPSPLVLNFRSGKQEDSPLRDLAYALAGGANPAPWWSESHQRILAATRALTWPSRLVDVETQACRIVGDEFYERLNSPMTGLHPNQWLRALAEETGTALRLSVAAGTGDWQQLWALLCGLALTVPPGDTQSETAKLARTQFPDIKDPYVTMQAEARKAAKLLADRGLTSGIRYPADGSRAAGDPMVACDTYGSRFLLVAPFSYDGKSPDHWYAWDIDACWILNVVGAGAFGSAQDALAEWQHAVGPAAGTALSPGAAETTARLLAPCLETGPLSDMLEGSEPPELIREYYRLRRRASALVGSAAQVSADGDDPDSVREAFLGWYTARHHDVPQDGADAVDTILDKWGPGIELGERSRYACSPHRIEMTARLIRDGYLPDHANATLRLLPEWTPVVYRAERAQRRLRGPVPRRRAHRGRGARPRGRT
jgi:hypothetical protein